MPLVTLPWRPWEQTRAIENARSASTELCRQRVEREEVEAFLDRLPARPNGDGAFEPAAPVPARYRAGIA